MSADIKNMILARRVELILRSLHISGTLKGLYYLIYAIVLAASSDGVSTQITKEIYPQVAHAFNSTPSRVERDIRFAIRTCWDRDTSKKALSKMAGCPIIERPTNREFIDIIVFHIRNTDE